MAAKGARGKLRITAGAGEGFELNGEVAARYSGRSVNDALMQIVQNEIRDPELQSMLSDPRLALELYGRDEDGEYQEVPLSPAEQWDRVLGQLEEADAELGIARSHAGGGRPCSQQHRQDRAMADRFPRQKVVVRPAGYDLSDTERAEVQEGKAVFLEGRVLAKVECLCTALGGREALWYYVASSTDTSVIRDVILPEQTVSTGYCRAEGTEVLKVARLARRRGLTIVAAGHSHGRSSVFSSTTDENQMSELAKERVARIATANSTIQGSIRRLQGHSGAGPGFEAIFVDNPGITVRITTKVREGGELKPEDLSVELVQTNRRMASWFSTHNCRGKHMVPMLSVTSCPQCGSKQERYVEPEHVVVHVIGPVEISKKDEADLRHEVKEKVKAASWWDDGGSDGDPDGGEPLLDKRSPPGSASTAEMDADEDRVPAPFLVYRHGRLVGTVSAATLERAAAETPSLAVALSWRTSEGRAGRQ